jgi:hypothetical protein
MLAFLIRAYRRSCLVKRAVRLMIAMHHAVIRADRTPCQLADCSGTGLAEAAALGWKALPGICSRVSACGAGLPAEPGQFCFDHTDPCTRALPQKMRQAGKLPAS